MAKVMCINGRMVTVEHYHYGCWNRAPLKDVVRVQAGWFDDGRARFEMRPDPMTKHCVYSQDYPNDPACTGCKHRGRT